LRWKEKCIIRCPRNYEKGRDERSGEYMCIPKKCEDRTPWKNKSCSLKEDFLSVDENSNSLISKCFYDNNSNENDNILNDYYDDEENYNTNGRCVREEECGLDFHGVCNFSIYYYVFNFDLYLFFFNI
jgi:hypothetical protein